MALTSALLFHHQILFFQYYVLSARRRFFFPRKRTFQSATIMWNKETDYNYWALLWNLKGCQKLQSQRKGYFKIKIMIWKAISPWLIWWFIHLYNNIWSPSYSRQNLLLGREQKKKKKKKEKVSSSVTLIRTLIQFHPPDLL